MWVNESQLTIHRMSPDSYDLMVNLNFSTIRVGGISDSANWHSLEWRYLECHVSEEDGNAIVTRSKGIDSHERSSEAATEGPAVELWVPLNQGVS